MKYNVQYKHICTIPKLNGTYELLTYMKGFKEYEFNFSNLLRN